MIFLLSFLPLTLIHDHCQAIYGYFNTLCSDTEMATGVLSFLRGIDLTRFPLGNGADEENSKLQDLHKVRWLKLARCGLKMLPPQIVCCKQLEELDIRIG